MVQHPVSVRFRDARVVERLRAEAAARGCSTSMLAEQMIDEGLRSRRHPLVAFRDGPGGRRAALVGGPDVWEIVGGVIGGNVPADRRVARAVKVFGWRPEQVEAALAYYADFTEEIQAEIEDNAAAAEEAETLWRRQQDLLAG